MATKAIFFKWVWRYNAIGLAIGISLSLLLLCFVLYQILTDLTRERRVSDLRHVGVEQQETTTYRLGSPRRIENQNIIPIPLLTQQRFAQSYFSKSSANNTINYAFFDTTTQTTKWLFDHRDYLIVETRTLPQQAAFDTPTTRATSYFYTVIKADSNDDERLTQTDDLTLSISDATGSRYTELFQNVHRLIGIQQTTANEVIILFEDHNGSHIASLSLDSYEVNYQQNIEMPERR